MRHYLFVVTFAATCLSQLLNVAIAKAQPEEIAPRWRIIFYHGDSAVPTQQAYKSDKMKDVLVHPDFDATKQTLLYLNDCFESFEESVKTIVNAYWTRRDHNILVLDYSAYRNDNYFEVVLPNIKRLSVDIAENILSTVNSGFNLRKLHVVGFSLGAQLGGLIGRAILEKSNRAHKLVRISGLDPTDSGFDEPTSNANYLPPLSISDAEFVDVIHTDAGFKGDESDLAIADFWPNFGHRDQPGCGSTNAFNKETAKHDSCSHKRAYLLWAESCTSDQKDLFLAVDAKNFTDFRKGALNLSQIATMGINCSLHTAKGNYYLQTNDASPYSRGVAGLIFTEPDGPRSDAASPEKDSVTA